MSNNFKIDIHNLKNFSARETLKFVEAMKRLERTIESRGFYDAIMNHEFDQANGKSNLELYQHFMDGTDNFNLMLDYDIDVNLTLYYSWKNTVGYTYPTTFFTWLNRKFFSKFNDAQVSMNVVHENRHNAGYGHRRASDHDSVPYAFGFIVRDLMNGIVPPNRYVKKRTYKKRWWQFWR